jgi:hypothetical protein
MIGIVISFFADKTTFMMNKKEYKETFAYETSHPSEAVPYAYCS